MVAIFHLGDSLKIKKNYRTDIFFWGYIFK